MADIDETMGTDTSGMKERAKETINNNRRGFGIGAGLAAALFTTGYVIGHKRGESQSTYQKIMRQLKS